MLFFTVAGNRGKMTKARKGEIRTGGEGESARGRRRKLDAVKDLGVKRERREKKKKASSAARISRINENRRRGSRGKKIDVKKPPKTT